MDGKSSKDIKTEKAFFKAEINIFMSQRVSKVFEPLRQLQKKRNNYKWIIKKLKSFAKEKAQNALISTSIRFILTFLLEMAFEAALANVRAILGFVMFSRTILKKSKKWKSNSEDSAAELVLIEQFLIPNIQLHLDYTKCNFYDYFYNFIENQIVSLSFSLNEDSELTEEDMEGEDSIDWRSFPNQQKAVRPRQQEAQEEE